MGRHLSQSASGLLNMFVRDIIVLFERLMKRKLRVPSSGLEDEDKAELSFVHFSLNLLQA